MAQGTIEELLKRCGSIYKLVILAAMRAKELAEGAPALMETPHKKATSIALEEILHGKVLYKAEEPDSKAGKKGRGVKAKEERKKKAT
ncbi:MAG: DNA-directed RNA polymerase subunit omega [Candidatus Omnitrophota bacterium]|nr:DNA-directed RNA polymerase subunit omega [Candidatus Omnitrophota bacterium]